MEKVLKLQNIIMQHDSDANIRSYGELVHISSDKNKKMSMVYSPEDKSHIIKRYDCIDFGTYFNCLQTASWSEHTNVKSFKLKLTFKGKGSLEIEELFRNSKNVNRNVLLQRIIESDEKTELIIDIPETDKPLIAFNITALEEFCIYKASYQGVVDEENIKNVKISLASTTFRKEAYIKNNIALLKKNVLCEGSDLKGHIFVHVIDNGRTLNPEEFDCEDLKVYPNPNVGGAGGFTRGMIEAMNLPEKPTHVLLMDDDVLIMCESLFRTYYLLRILKDEYKDSFVSGAMFDYDSREVQYEDVGYVHPEDASYGPVKERMDMRLASSLVKNEEMAKRKMDNSYAGWWYCCIPVQCIEKNGLPLPVFVRGDDVEFSLRNKATFITLNGICIWHVGFAGKFVASMELYQVHRNSLVIQAASNIFPEIDIMKRLKGLFWRDISRLAYNNAEQILDSIDDFMKGPEFLKNANGEEIIKAHGAKNEKLMPISEFRKNHEWAEGDPYEYWRLSAINKLFFKITVNGHLLPGFLLKSRPVVVAYDWFYSPGKYFKRKRLIAMNANDNTVCMREMNRKRCFSLIRRYRKTMRNYEKNHVAVEAQYREAMKEMTSLQFWKEYLGI
ncbi:MAG: glycosyltransferase family 2 protein [Ruminococcus sp.]|nr:glycosyltransferase family 2 protein [Ruminococcus sp.]